jgi:hypothetical protein
MLWPERKLFLVETLAAAVAIGLVAVLAVVVWWLAAVLPAAALVLVAAAPLGLALRLAPAAPTLPHKIRVWHARTLSRWLTTATARRWDDTTDRWNGQEDV